MKILFTIPIIASLLYLSVLSSDGADSTSTINDRMGAFYQTAGRVFRDTVVKDKTIQLIADSLESTSQRLPVEKVYLHTDKPYYNIGDTIWFKAYLVDNATHSASKISNVLYIQLDNDSAEVADRISIRVRDGIGWGQIPLRKIQYQEGNYTLRAYTSWMQNFYFNDMFSQRFYLGTPVEDAWLAKSVAQVTRVDNRNRLQVSLFLTRIDKTLSPVILKDVEVKVYDDLHRVLLKEMRTGLDGGLELDVLLRDNINGRRLRVEITSLDPADNDKTIQVPLVINRSQKIDLQFLPEGGSLSPV